MTAIRPFKLSLCFSIKLALLSTIPLPAQTLLTDSAFHQASITRSFERYQAAMDPDNRLYNGPEYLLRGQGVKGNPFFLSDSLLPGYLHYDDAIFNNIQLQYDIVQDDVIIDDYTHSAHIQLVKEKIKDFTIRQHRFRFLDPGKNASDFMKPGFYEQLTGTADSPLSLYARHEKKIDFPANPEEQARYAPSDSYFLQWENAFYQVETKRALLEILKDKKDLLKKYIGENNIDFKKNLELALIKTTSYYAQIRP
ncbi:MAG TPA: hypothetical protein VNS58_09460 [Puia sp.]|nr:hypothetical protein [Puia sp.]